MTSKRDLGPPLALAGLAVVVVAVIAGFIAVGGPGDARDRRLDEMTTTHLHDVANAAQCAFSFKGTAPGDMSEIRNALAEAIKASPNRTACDAFTLETPLSGADYTRIADNRIRLCADFRRPYDPDGTGTNRYLASRSGVFPELLAARPAGHHCYEILLVASSKPAN
ncbi:MAG TPA: hypothetical protein VGO52_21960 [Hyphomonadaceae bacterium]|jgi:hypothetical protein|nr:hypothetical protein [Hyphomonadaceae bacterium]